MKPVDFGYVRADSAAAAIALLAAEQGSGKLIGGGQSLGPVLNLRLARPSRLIDIKRAGLRTVADSPDRLAIGAAWTHAEIEDGVVEDPTQGLLRHVAAGIAYRAVRNRGTLGGSLAHADPAADWLSTMMVLDATIVLVGPAGTRRLAIGDFLLGAMTTALADDEVLVSVEVPRLSGDARWGYAKICRKTGEFARAIGAAVIDRARSLTRVVVGATTGAPVLLPAASAALATTGPEAAVEAAAGELAAMTLGSQHLAAVSRALATMTQGPAD